MSDHEQVEVTEPTYQQNLVMQRLNELFAAVESASFEHDKRAEKLAMVAGGIVAFIGGTAAISDVIDRATPIADLATLAVFVLAICIFRLCASVWRPAATIYPTSPDADLLYSEYIAKDVYDAYNRQLRSLSDAVVDNQAKCEVRAGQIDSMMLLLQFQIVAVAMAVLFRSLQM